MVNSGYMVGVISAFSQKSKKRRQWLCCWFVKLDGVILDISVVICNGHMYMSSYLIAVYVGIDMFCV